MAFVKENKQKLSELYNRMANQLAAELPDGWTHFCLGYCVSTSGEDDMMIFVTDDGGENWRDFMDDVFEADDIMFGVFDCKESCQELYELCKKVGDRWSHFTLMVDDTGHFDATFKYEPFDEMNPILKSMWIGEYLE